MKVTRDVIYDLLPAYFAREISADTKTLIEEFFATDPEFGRMAERFRTLQQDMTSSRSIETARDREREAFDRARAQFRRQKMAMMWSTGAASAFLLAMLTPGPTGPTLTNPALILSFLLAAAAGVTWMMGGRQ